MPKKFFRTIVVTEILAEDTPWNSGSVNDPLPSDCTDCGDCSGKILSESSEEVSPEMVARLLQSHDSGSEFFGLDENGRLLRDMDEPKPSRPYPMEGQNAVCKGCGNPIEYMPGGWEHTDGITYRHPCEPGT